MSILRVDLLGPLSAMVDGRRVAVPGRRQAALLACLALQAPHAVSVPTLIDAVWFDQAPRRAEPTLQQHVSTLRAALEPSRPKAAPSLVRTEGAGYRLELTSGDIADFEAASRRAEGATAAGRWQPALAELDAALGLWRGPALDGVVATPWFGAHRVRLAERRAALAQTRLAVLVNAGRNDQAIADAEAILAQEPLRESVWATLMIALYRTGRSADALAAFQRARRTLDDELGIQPGASLQALERRVLHRDPSLAEPAPHGPPTGSGIAPLHVEVSQTFRSDGIDAVPWLELPDGQIVVLRDGVHDVGRIPEVSIQLRDSRVSRRHAEFSVIHGAVHLRDLGSTNGTAVNGRSVTQAQLTDRDAVSIGGVPMTFHSPR